VSSPSPLSVGPPLQSQVPAGPDEDDEDDVLDVEEVDDVEPDVEVELEPSVLVESPDDAALELKLNIDVELVPEPTVGPLDDVEADPGPEVEPFDVEPVEVASESGPPPSTMPAGFVPEQAESARSTIHPHVGRSVMSFGPRAGVSSTC
jgi:hypothetical protein